MVSKMKFKVNNTLIIEERDRLGGGASGWIIYRKPYTIIQVKRNLSNKEKALVIIHELAHYIQYKMDDNNTQRAREEIAKRIENLFINILNKYPPFLAGITELRREKWKNTE